MFKKTIGTATLVVIATAGIGAHSASAAPGDGKGPRFAAHCDAGIGDVTVVTNSGNGSFTPGKIAGTNQQLLPYEIHDHGTFTPADGSPPQSFTDVSMHQAPANARKTTCTFHAEGADDYGSFVVDGTVLATYTPSHTS
jgi:hypothetical protein